MILVRGTNHKYYFIKLFFLIIEPLVYIVLGILIWAAIFWFKKRRILGNDVFKRRIFITTIVIIYILQPGVIKATLSLYK